MFLWASLVIEELRDTPAEDIREKLQSIPSGLDSLYNHLLGQLGKQKTMATKILMWVVNSPRPMTIDELAWACEDKVIIHALLQLILVAYGRFAITSITVGQY